MTDKWVVVPKQLTFGMRIALEEALISFPNDLDRIYREILDFAPYPHPMFDGVTVTVEEAALGGMHPSDPNSFKGAK